MIQKYCPSSAIIQNLTLEVINTSYLINHMFHYDTQKIFFLCPYSQYLEQPA